MVRAFARVGCEIVRDPPVDLEWIHRGWLSRRYGPLARPRAVWLVDEPYHWGHRKAWSRHADYVFVNDRGALGAHREGRTHWLPPAYEPFEVSDPIACDVAIIGRNFRARRRVLRKLWPYLSRLDVRIAGSRWPEEWPVVAEWLEPEEAARYYAGATVNINIHRQAWGPECDADAPTPTGLNFRAFEIAAVGGFQIMDEREDAAIFLPSAVTFDGTADDLRRKIAYYLSHDNERRAIAEACRREVAPHTFDVRAKTVLRVLA